MKEMIMKANTMVLFNDIELFLKSNKTQYKKEVFDIVNKKIYEMSFLFSNKEIKIIDYYSLLQSIRMQLEIISLSKYDCILTVGDRGNDFWNDIKDLVPHLKKRKIDIKRCFVDEKLDTLETKYLYNKQQIEEIKEILNNNCRVLLVDDIYFSGGTINKLVELLNLREIDIITLVSFRINAVRILASGMYIDKKAWPDEDTDIMCVSDFFDELGMVFENGKSRSFIQDEFSKRWCFAEKIFEAKKIIQEITTILDI